MNILIINTAYTGGGAEKVTRQIADIMRNRGHNVYIVVGYNSTPISDENVTVLYDGIAWRVINRIVTNNHSNANLKIRISLDTIKKIIEEKNIDIVHLNNAHGNYLGIKDIEQISKCCPVVWTIHDFWPVTGHCAYTYGCGAWRTGCGSCPNLSIYPSLRHDITGRLLAEKAKAFCKKGIKFVSPSVWLKNQLKDSILKDEDIRVIYNSIDLKRWKMLDKEKVRKKLNLDLSKITLAFVAASLSEPRKGARYLIEALCKIENPEKYQLLIAGNSEMPELQELDKKYTIRYFGFIKDETKMNEFFAAADYFINPSVDDIFGLVNIEALASGTHVIAFDVCAIHEILDLGCGLKVKDISGDALKNGICVAPNILTETPKLKDCFDQNVMAKQYEELYEETVRGWTSDVTYT